MFLVLPEFDVSSISLGPSSSDPVVVTEFVDTTSLVVTEFVDTTSLVVTEFVDTTSLVVTEFVDTISGSVESSSSKLHTMSTASPTRKHTYFSVISYMQRMFSVKTNMYGAIRHSMFFEN